MEKKIQGSMEEKQEVALLMHEMLCRGGDDCRFAREIHPGVNGPLHNWSGVSHVKFLRSATPLVDALGYGGAVAQVNELASAMHMD